MTAVPVRDVRDRVQEAKTPSGTVTIERSVSGTTAVSAVARLTISRLSLDGLRRGQAIRRTFPSAEYQVKINGIQWRPLSLRFLVSFDADEWQIRMPRRLHCEIRASTGKELLHEYPDGRLTMDEELDLREATLLTLCYASGLTSGVSTFYWLTF
jgi:hypothetical protein